MTRTCDAQVVQAEAWHAARLVTRLREDDRREIMVAGKRPARELWHAYRESLFANSVLVEGEVAAMFGVGGSPFHRVVSPWMLTAPEFERIPKFAVKVGREYVAFCRETYPYLLGLVDDNYTRAIKYLKVIGFNVGEPFPYGPYGVPFRHFTLERG